MAEKLTREELLQRPKRFEPYEKLARNLARSLHRKTQARGYSHIEFDDVFGGVCEIWCKCRDGFDPEQGFQFDTYFTRAVAHSYRDVIKRNTDKSLRFAKSGAVEIRADEAYSTDILDTIDGGLINPEEEASRAQVLDTLTERTPLLAAFVKLLRDNPQDLQDELAALVAQGEHARAQGFDNFRAHKELDLVTLSRLFGFNWRHRQRLAQEIKEVADLV